MIGLLFFLFTVHADPTTVVQGIRNDISSLDPYSVVSVDSFEITSSIIEPLFRLDPFNGSLIPWLATEVRTYPKEKRFRVRLRPNITFHNGEKLSAEDVEFTFMSFANPEYKAGIWQGMWPDIAKVIVVDQGTVDFIMKKWRYQSYESVLTSMRILPKSFYKKIDKSLFQIRIVGTGPFELEHFEVNSNLRLKPNTKWWGKSRPKFKLLIKRVPSQDLAQQMFAKNELDFFKADRISEENPQMEVVKVNSLGHGFWIDFNLKNPLFQSSKLRRALLLLWQRADLNQKIFSGQMKLALDIFSPNTGYYPKASAEKYDLKKAVQLLKEDGWKDEDHDQILEKDGQKLAFKIMVRNSEHERWVSLYQQDAAKVGIKINIESVIEDAQWFKRLQDGKFEAFAGDGGLISEPTSLAWQSQSFYNFSRYKNEEVDRLTASLDSEFEPQKRRLIMRKLITIIRKDQPQVPGLISLNDIYLTSKRLRIDSRQPTRPWLWQLH